VFARNDGVIVALGDSITEGFSSDRPVHGEAPWTNTFARRLHRWAGSGGPKLSIVNVGISGNRVLTDERGPSAVKRVGFDVLRQSGLRAVIMMEGINDLAPSPQDLEMVSLGQMIKGYRTIIRRVRDAGARLWLSPLTPAGDARRPTPFLHSATPEQVERRHQINRWIRGESGVYDGRVDFEPIVLDPQNPNWLRLRYDSGDNLHPNNAGYAAMGRGIKLRAFAGLGCG
jgi:lysophospholipase L1-like esterase